VVITHWGGEGTGGTHSRGEERLERNRRLGRFGGQWSETKSQGIRDRAGGAGLKICRGGLSK